MVPNRAKTRSAKRDVEALWRVFYDRSFADVSAYALRLTGGHRATAEDLVHDAYLAMVRAWRDGRVDHLDTGWLIVVVRQRFLNSIRNGRREDRRLRLVHGSPSSVEPSTEESSSDGSIAALLGGLSDRARAALVMRYVDDLPVAAVADGLGLTVRATESLLVRARGQIRRQQREERHG
ncbi:MAG: putative polymerase sigma factor, sigma-70 family [Ilumatobacteraceae bacterium]|nr:putative polymerase sigma factor, sigma-70 family [Ilumatobacteraceae bacterium]